MLNFVFSRWARLAILVFFLFAVLQRSPWVLPVTALSPSEAKAGFQGVKLVVKQLLEAENTIDAELDGPQLQAVAATVSYTLPRVQLALNHDHQQLMTALTIELVPSFVYINTRCLLQNTELGVHFTQCRLGYLPLPAAVVKGFLSLVVWLSLGDEGHDTFNSAFRHSSITPTTLALRLRKSDELVMSIKTRVSGASGVWQQVRQRGGISAEELAPYLDTIMLSASQQTDSGEVVAAAMRLAMLNSFDSSAVQANRLALWALALTFGAADFAQLIGLPAQPDKMLPEQFTLHSRMDLRLHFFFSMAMVLAGEETLSLNVGKYKELLDSSGGSGFSFVDLAADMAGIAFAVQAIQSEASAKALQQRLLDQPTQQSFMPSIEGLPEGIMEAEFAQQFGDEDDPRFKIMEQKIRSRIDALYQN